MDGAMDGAMDGSPGNLKSLPRLTPESGATLFRLEAERRKGVYRRGTIPTGCSEIDDMLLSEGGFERGCVVGISVEAVDLGVLLGLQTIARALISGHAAGDVSSPRSAHVSRAVIVTTLPTTAILPVLRDVIRSQAQIKFGPGKPEVEVELRRCLEAISISRIFDIEGLWEVLRELEGHTEATHGRDENETETATSPHLPSVDQEEIGSEIDDGVGGLTDETRHENASAESDLEPGGDGTISTILLGSTTQEPIDSSPGPITGLPPLRIGSEFRPPTRKSEILDSEDEEPFSPSSPSSHASTSEGRPEPPSGRDARLTPPPISSPKSTPQEREIPPSKSTEDQTSSSPDIILVTHFSSLLTSLFTHHEKTNAHSSLQQLASYLRRLARSTGPLIMLLNTTTSHSHETSTSTSASAAHGTISDPNRHGPTTPPGPEIMRGQRPLDPTLRSIFNPAPQFQPRPRGHGYGHGGAAARRNKPSFGATFAQLLDLHLLCTKVPRTRDDAETAVSLGAGAEDVRYAWVIEVLLDELGGSGRDGEGRGVVNREQRWGAVDVLDGVRIADAFARGGGSSHRALPG
ncbi:hypothetical protein F4861DRAFT_509353 [Xylaria intraflava]|nr:hypothetical protein F4861DRAFT_509353 [Xylaria intraflava]